jgi:hypothetical protein
MSTQPVQTFYRFHPATGQDANEFDTASMPEKDRIELAEMVRAGAKFYWEGPGKVGEGYLKGYGRIERANVEFVLRVTGVRGEWIETALRAGS